MRQLAQAPVAPKEPKKAKPRTRGATRSDYMD
jgi:hypothetical protein